MRSFLTFSHYALIGLGVIMILGTVLGPIFAYFIDGETLLTSLLMGAGSFVLGVFFCWLGLKAEEKLNAPVTARGESVGSGLMSVILIASFFGGLAIVGAAFAAGQYGPGGILFTLWLAAMGGIWTLWRDR